MVKHIVTKTWMLGAIGLLAAVFLLLGGSSKPHGVVAGGGGAAGAPGTTVAPLLSCPNVDGSADNRVAVADILAVVHAFFRDWPQTNYQYLFDLVGPYNPETGMGGQERIPDILEVVHRFFESCPLADTQVARATLWTIDTDFNPGNGLQPVPVIEDSSALASLGYVMGSTDVPGQGKHYTKLANWDGTFDPAAPEGLVYSNGPEDAARGSCHDFADNGGGDGADMADTDCQTYRLAAQLYVVNGDIVGWLEDPLSATPGPCWDGIDNGGDGQTDAADGDCGAGNPVGSPLDDINIDPVAHNCGGTNGCSWGGDEGWHLHYRLCTIHIGTPNAAAIPLQDQGSSFNYQGQCDGYQASNLICPASPGCGGTGTHVYNARVGWMGHLWNHIPNANRVPDAGTEDRGDPDGQGPCTDGIDNGNDGLADGADPDCTNGRFSDCYPDYGVWGPYNCPQ